MTRYFKLLLFLTFVLTTNFLTGQDSSIFSEKNSADFANYLYQTNQYKFASEEYERLIFNFPSNEEYKLKLIRCYRLSNEYSKGISICQAYPNPLLLSSKPILLEYTKLNILDHRYTNIGNTLYLMDSKDSLRSTIDLATRLIFLTGESMNINGIDLKLADPQLVKFHDEYYTLKHKSPALAGIMSSIVPGSGKFYTNRWKDGLISFVFVGLTTFQAYRGFDQKGIESVYGWIMGGFAVSFYVGNIYGSAKSAKVYNQTQRNNYVDKVSDYFMDRY